MRAWYARRLREVPDPEWSSALEIVVSRAPRELQDELRAQIRALVSVDVPKRPPQPRTLRCPVCRQDVPRGEWTTHKAECEGPFTAKGRPHAPSFLPALVSRALRLEPVLPAHRLGARLMRYLLLLLLLSATACDSIAGPPSVVGVWTATHYDGQPLPVTRGLAVINNVTLELSASHYTLTVNGGLPSILSQPYSVHGDSLTFRHPLSTPGNNYDATGRLIGSELHYRSDNGRAEIIFTQ